MTYLNLLLEVLTIISLISALAVITSTNPVIAIVFLIILFLNVGIYLILMGLQFIGLSYLLVYVGAITVLFLFIVMMISTEVVSTVEVGPDYSKLLPLAYSVAILFLVLFLITIPSFFVDFTSGTLGREFYSAINGFIFGTNSTGNVASHIEGSNNNFGNGTIFAFIQSVLDLLDYLFFSIFGHTNVANGVQDSFLHPLAWAPENMGNDSFSLFLADSLDTLNNNFGINSAWDFINSGHAATLNMTKDSINTVEFAHPSAIIEQYNWSPLFNQLFFVEFNSATSSLIGQLSSGELGETISNPAGFYYYHPLVHSSVNKGLTTFNSGAESLPYLFPLGWYSDDPFALFLQWVSNKNIGVFLWHNLNPSYFTYFDTNSAPGNEFLPWVNILFANTATNVNYAGAAYSKWFSSSSADLIDMGANLHAYRKFILPSVLLHNYFLNISWLGIPYFPEFLVEFPQSPVFSPIYFPQHLVPGGSEHDFGTVYHIIERYNGINENILLINESAFGDPVTLLHKNLQIATLGQSIYGAYSILLILSSFLLLLAMVCPIVLARNNSQS